MGLLDNKTDQSYYAGSQNFTYTSGNQTFTLSTLSPMPTLASEFNVFINGLVTSSSNIAYDNSSKVVTISNVTLSANDLITVTLKSKVFGTYRYISLVDIINNYMIAYVGNGKLINKARRSDVLFHAKRGIQEFAYDITRVEKIQEVEVGPTLSIPMPKDYVSIVNISWVDLAGIEHPIPKGRITSKPSEAVAQDSDFNYTFDADGNLIKSTSLTSERFKDFNNGTLTHAYTNDDYFFNQEFPEEKLIESGKRFGGEPELMNRNGIYIIDEANGTINFSSEINEKLVNIRYISDSLGSDAEMKVHKFAEDAIYKYISFSLANTKVGLPEYIINRLRKDKRAAMRNAKIRLYEISLSEINQTMKGKSKHIKH